MRRTTRSARSPPTASPASRLPPTLAALDALDRELNGKSSALGALKRQLGSLEPDERRTVGQALNEAQTAIRSAASARRAELAAQARAVQLAAERLDLTELRPPRRAGHLHLVTQTMERLEDVFVGMGFTVAEGPEVEDDWHNFTALNLPARPPRPATCRTPSSSSSASRATW